VLEKLEETSFKKKKFGWKADVGDTEIRSNPVYCMPQNELLNIDVGKTLKNNQYFCS